MIVMTTSISISVNPPRFVFTAAPPCILRFVRSPLTHYNPPQVSRKYTLGPSPSFPCSLLPATLLSGYPLHARSVPGGHAMKRVVRIIKSRTMVKISGERWDDLRAPVGFAGRRSVWLLPRGAACWRQRGGADKRIETFGDRRCSSSGHAVAETVSTNGVGQTHGGYFRGPASVARAYERLFGNGTASLSGDPDVLGSNAPPRRLFSSQVVLQYKRPSATSVLKRLRYRSRGNEYPAAPAVRPPSGV